MVKPAHIDGYDPKVTEACEQVLVTLLRGLGPFRESVYLVGGLVPRYLVSGRPPEIKPHAGTGDVDVVIEMTIQTDTEAYSTLEQNLDRMGFERATNKQGRKVSWQWKNRLEGGLAVMLEFLAEGPDGQVRVAETLPTKGNVSAMHIPHASIVHDYFESIDIKAELLGEKGTTTETIKYADIIAFTCLKAFAFDQRAEPKDAHDLIYCLENSDIGFEEIVAKFAAALGGGHKDTVSEALDILRKRFCNEGEDDGYRKDGPIAVMKFELGEEMSAEDRDRHILRQREVNTLVEKLLAEIEALVKFRVSYF